MSRLPFPISDNWSDARPQIEELLRIIFEERIGGLKVSSSLEKRNDTLSLLLGAANSHLLTNADGDEVEYAVPYKIVTVTRDLSSASADVSTTGVGFMPASAIFFGSYGTSGVNSFGIAQGTSAGCIYSRADQAVTEFFHIASVAIRGETAAGTDYQSAVVKSWDDDGFTLTWTKEGSPTGTLTIHVLCFR